MPKDTRGLTASEINRELERLRAKSSRITAQMIEDGRGNELPSETMKKSDPLSIQYRETVERLNDLRNEIRARTGQDYHRMPTRRRNANPPRRPRLTRGRRQTTKTIEVFLPMTKARATEWLRERRIPFTRMREHFNGVAFRIRQGYLLDFMHEKDKSAPRYNRYSARLNGARKARRRNAPVKHGARETFELAYYQGYAIEVAYRRELDGKLYSHKVETDAAEVYLAKHPVFGHCVVILDPSGKTPLWK